MLHYLSLFIVLFFAYLNSGLFFVLKSKLKLSVLEKLLLAFVLGVIINTSLISLLSLVFNLGAYYCLILTTCLGLFTFLKEKELYLKFKNLIFKHKTTSFYLLTLILILASGLFFSGQIKADHIYLKDIYDTSWHMALQKSLLNSLPPRHPSNPKILLNNYHYFYDLFLASLEKFSSLGLIAINYQVSQLIIASLLILTAYVFGRRFKGENYALVLVFLITFAGNFAYLIPLFIPNQAWSESSFWVSQTFSMLVNPQLIFSFATLFLVFLLMSNDFNKELKTHFFLIPLIASSIAFKTYAWIVLSLVYACYLLLNFLKEKNWNFILIGCAYLLFALPYFYLITGFQSGSFFWKPFWFIDTMIEAPDRVNYLPWHFEILRYRRKKEFFKLAYLRSKELFIFYFGNLGTRSIFVLLPLFFKKHFKKQGKLIVLTVIAFIFSSVFPLLFLQTGTVWNSIQFWYYSLILANILAALILEKILLLENKFFKVLLLSIFLGLTLPAFLRTMPQKWQHHNQFKWQDLNYLNTLESSDMVLICPEETELFKYSFVNAHTPAKVYLSDPGQLSLVEASLDEVENFKQIFKEKNSLKLKQLVEQEKISHILCSHQAMIDFMDQDYLANKKRLSDWTVYDLTANSK